MQISRMSFRASILVCVVLIVRFFFSKLHAPKKYLSYLWLLVYVAMILPVSAYIETPFSIWNLESEGNHIVGIQEENAGIFGETQEEKVEGISNGSEEVTHKNEANGWVSQDIEKDSTQVKTKTVAFRISVIYAIGLGGFLSYGLISSLLLKRKLLCSLWLREEIYVADDIKEPFVFGIFSPKIYLPTNLAVKNELYVIEHEKTHIMRKDALKKALAFLITGLHWFNPFSYVAFSLMTRDMEMACDEETIQRIGAEKRQDYAKTLVELSAKRRNLFVPVAFGEDHVKSRIKNIMRQKKAVRIISVAIVLCVIVLAVVFFTKPKEETKATDMEENWKEEIPEVMPEVTPEVTEPSRNEELEMMHPEVCGTINGPFLDYANENYVVFHSRTQFFVYDIRAQKLTWQETFEGSFESIDSVKVTKDGSKAYIYGTDVDAVYVYECNIQNGTELTLNLPDEEEVALDKGLYVLKDIIEWDVTVFQSTNCAKISENEFLYLQSGSGLLEDLMILIGDSQSNTQVEYPVFSME